MLLGQKASKEKPPTLKLPVQQPQGHIVKVNKLQLKQWPKVESKSSLRQIGKERKAMNIPSVSASSPRKKTVSEILSQISDCQKDSIIKQLLTPKKTGVYKKPFTKHRGTAEHSYCFK